MSGADLHTSEQAVATRSVTAAEFVALKRERVRPYVSSVDERSVLLAPSTILLVGGPSGLGKSCATLDLGGMLGGPGGEWLGLRVVGGLRVLLVVFDGEGSDEDLSDRVAALVPPTSALRVWDRWRLGPAPRADSEGVKALAHEVQAHEIDVVILDTASAFAAPRCDISKGILEVAHEAFEEVRKLSGRPLAFVLPVHTRKDDSRPSKGRDELEELAGTFARKADAAIVIRRDGKDGPHSR